MVPIARNSDCQFWNVRFQKSAIRMYSSQPTACAPCVVCSSLYCDQLPSDSASQEAKKIAVIASSSEFSYTRRRQSFSFAHRGALPGACLPTFASSSVSSPASFNAFDSVEPFWTSQTVTRMKRVNWRNSDCQFSITLPPKSEETR